MRRLLLIAALLVTVASHAGCSDDDDNFGPFAGGLGAPCRDDRDCFDRCDEGFCTARCDHDAHCPGGWACVDEHGGICAPVCTSPAACGPGYPCDSTRRRGAGGSITVCLR
jgi:hypothetical protein